MLNKINEDLKTALKQGDNIAKSVLRYLKSEIHNREISIGSSLTNEQIIDVLNKQAKQRRESIEAYTNGNRSDLVEIEEKEGDEEGHGDGLVSVKAFELRTFLVT